MAWLRVSILITMGVLSSYAILCNCIWYSYYHDIISLSLSPSQVSIAKACMKLGYNVTLITETCNESVIRAAVDGETRLYMPNRMHRDCHLCYNSILMQT